MAFNSKVIHTYVYIYILIYETFYFGLKFIAAPKPSNEIFI